MKYLQYLISIILLMLMCSNACYSQKVILEQIPWTYIADKDPDSRLAQKIDYEAWHTPLKTIIADLTKQTGVELHAGYSNQDWQVRDRRMNVYVKGIALGELMDSISRVMKFKWTQKGEKTSSTYTLNLDRKLLAKMQAEADKRANELAEAVRKRRTDLINKFESISKMSDKDIAKLKKDEPYLYMCAETGFAELVIQLFREVPGLKDMAVNGDHDVQISYSTLSKSTQAMYCDVMREYAKYDTIQNNRDPFPDDIEKWMPGCAIQCDFQTRPWEFAQRNQMNRFGGIGSPVHINGRAFHHKAGYLQYPESDEAKAKSSAVIAASAMDKGGKEYFQDTISKFYEKYESDDRDVDYYFMLDPIDDYPKGKELDKIIDAQLSAELSKSIEDAAKVMGDGAYSRLSYQALQKIISSGTNLNVVSDSFAVVMGDNKPGTKEQASRVLAKMCKSYLCNCEKHGSVLEIRRRDWFRRRTSQIPDELVEEWRNIAKTSEILPLDTYAQIITLSSEQTEENISSDKLLSESVGIWWEPWNSEGLMRFYLQLNPMQKRLLFSEDGLDTSMLNRDQRQYYKDMFGYGLRMPWYGATELGNLENQAMIKATYIMAKKGDLQCIEDTGGIQYTFKVTADADGETKADDWTIHLPYLKTVQDAIAAVK